MMLHNNKLCYNKRDTQVSQVSLDEFRSVVVFLIATFENEYINKVDYK